MVMANDPLVELEWLLRILKCRRDFWHEVTYEDFRILKMERRNFLRRKHPDKHMTNMDDGERAAVVSRFNNAWDELRKRIPVDWLREEVGANNAAASGSARPNASHGGTSPGTGNNTRQRSEAAGQGATQEGTRQAEPCPCPFSPHCENFNSKYQALAERKQWEYRFLYSAQAHCVMCMAFYSAVPGFNVHCTSMNKTARGWATTSSGRRRSRQPAPIPEDVEAWLSAHGL